jgi:hypothetical protein
VGVADGIETVIAPPEADGPGQNVRWYPFAVTWSPDGATLLYAAWRSGMPPGVEDGRAHVIAVPIDTPSVVTVRGLGGLGDAYGHGWALPQRWGRHPG